MPEPPAVRSKPAALEPCPWDRRALPPRRIVALRAPRRANPRAGRRADGFGSPQTLAVAFRKGGWIAIRTARRSRTSSSAGCAPPRSGLCADRSNWRSTCPGSSSRCEAKGSRRISVAIGAADTPTPAGEFYVTDKLQEQISARTTAAASRALRPQAEPAPGLVGRRPARNPRLADFDVGPGGRTAASMPTARPSLSDEERPARDRGFGYTPEGPWPDGDGRELGEPLKRRLSPGVVLVAEVRSTLRKSGACGPGLT